MATDLTSGDATAREPEAAPPTESQPVDRPAGALPRTHRLRFGLLYGGLAVILGLAVAGVALYATDSINSGPAWSTWKPSGGGLGAAKQIVEHVAPGYRLPDGKQLVDVIPNGPVFVSGGQKIPIPLVAVRGKQGVFRPDQVERVGDGDTLTYSLCGLGDACAIASGKPSVQRGTVVRREIIELALYTFKYVRGITRVVAFMPPPAGTQPTYVVYLRKDDLSEQLKHPLVQTLDAKVPLPTQVTAKEQQQVDALTEPHTYKFGLSQTQQGEPVLVLDPLQA